MNETYDTADAVCNELDRIAKQKRTASGAGLADALRALIRALPQCSAKEYTCGRPATRSTNYVSHEPDACDEHAAEIGGGRPGRLGQWTGEIEAAEAELAAWELCDHR